MRSLHLESNNIFIRKEHFQEKREDDEDSLKKVVNFLHRDDEFLVAAETGNDKILKVLIKRRINIQQKDHLGRNALHLAVCGDSLNTIIMLLDAGVNPNVKDNLGRTPLSMCLVKKPSLKVTRLLFDHGAVILPRMNPMDTGLFLQFVMLSTPTKEEEKILHLLIEKGAIINDFAAPGRRQALHFAAMSNNCNLIRILVDLGADLFILNHRRETPKQVAVSFGCKEAEALLEALEELIPGKFIDPVPTTSDITDALLSKR